MPIYLSAGLAAFILSFVFTKLAERIALKLKVVDLPNNRKIHKEPIPLLGGVAIFLSFSIILFFVKNYLTAGNLNLNHWLWFFLGGFILIIGGCLDDFKNLKPKYQIIFPILAIICIIFGKIGIEKISNPFGGLLFFNNFISDIFTAAWLMAIMYTTKLLDGLDGLVAGIAFIGGLIIFLFTITTRYYQPDIALSSIIFACSCAGFLILNWHPAKIFLGEGGSLFIGYVIGVLSIISGGKIAIALLILGLPILDVAWTIIRRLLAGKNPFKTADKKHLHHRFLEMGLSQRKTVLLFYAFSTFFGLSGLFLQSRGKFFAVSILSLIMIGFIISFSFLEKRFNTKKIEN